MSLYRRLSLKSGPRSAWPVVRVMLLALMAAGAYMLGRKVLYLIPLLAVCALAFHALKALYREARDKGRELPDTGELPYGFAGHDLRAFSDSAGQVWIRARDIRHLLGHERSDAWMAQAYPQGYRRAHPGVAAWYIHPDTVRRHWSGSTRIDVNRFIHWMDRELVPLQEKRNALARAEERATPTPVKAERRSSPWSGLHRPLVNYFAGHWRGQHRLLHVALSGAVLALLIGHVLQDRPAPADLVEHYRRYALLLIFELLGGTLLCAWWGVGVWRSTRRWLGAERSLLVGLAFAMGGMTTLLHAFDRVADRDQQMTLLTLGVMAADLDPKPVVTLSPDGKQLSLAGEMGFGTTNLVRAALGRHPGITGIELNSPGGSAAEGFALAELVRDRGLDTYVRADCASACVLVFAGGHERLAAPSARFGLHRSGIDWRRGDPGVSATDLAMERFFRQQGVADDFIARTLETPFRDIWVPSAGEVMASGLASGVWTLPGAPG